MTKETFFLTTGDFSLLEAMRDRCLGRDDPLVPILKRKLESAMVMFRGDIPVNVATLGSRVTFSVNGRDPDTRIISRDRAGSPIGIVLPITTTRGLALLGLSEGQQFAITNGNGEEERVLLHQVHYQPEAAKRTSDVCQLMGSSAVRKPQLRVIRGALYDQPTLRPAPHDGFDDPGPSAA